MQNSWQYAWFALLKDIKFCLHWNVEFHRTKVHAVFVLLCFVSLNILFGKINHKKSWLYNIEANIFIKQRGCATSSKTQLQIFLFFSFIIE